MADPVGPDDPERDRPGPTVWVALPDGQSVTAQCIGRPQRLGPGGGWWCELLLPVWAEVQLPDRITVEPDSAVFRVPAHLVTPIEGTDYSTVPTRRERLPPRPPRPPRLGGWSVRHLPAPARRRPRAPRHPPPVVLDTDRRRRPQLRPGAQ
ncbi:hypothetical protein SAZ11_62505 [Streptomyces sp. FXJ1.4098]|nr:hypothetical protein [Streptomyces sp. FXJ1.4098]